MDSNLFKTDKCSPIVAYVFILLLFGIMIYFTNNNFKKLNNYKVDNVFTIFAWNEISLLLIIGIVLFGLCQYNQELLSWLILFIPIILLVIKVSIIYPSISNIGKHIPTDEMLYKGNEIKLEHKEQGKVNDTTGAMFHPLSGKVENRVDDKVNMITNLNKPQNLDMNMSPPLLNSSNMLPPSPAPLSTF